MFVNLGYDQFVGRSHLQVTARADTGMQEDRGSELGVGTGEASRARSPVLHCK